MIRERSKQLLFLLCLSEADIYAHLSRGMEGAVYYGTDSEHQGTDMPEVVLLEMAHHFLSDEINLGCDCSSLAELCWLIATMSEVAARAPNEVRLRFLESHDFFWVIIRRYSRLVLDELGIRLEYPKFNFIVMLESYGYSVKFPSAR